jgi:lysophospholipase L1-like esterase
MKMSPSGEAAVLAALTTFMACGLAEQNTRDGVVRPDWSVRQGADRGDEPLRITKPEDTLELLRGLPSGACDDSTNPSITTVLGQAQRAIAGQSAVSGQRFAHAVDAFEQSMADRSLDPRELCAADAVPDRRFPGHTHRDVAGSFISMTLAEEGLAARPIPVWDDPDEYRGAMVGHAQTKLFLSSLADPCANPLDASAACGGPKTLAGGSGPVPAPVDRGAERADGARETHAAEPVAASDPSTDAGERGRESAPDSELARASDSAAMRCLLIGDSHSSGSRGFGATLQRGLSCSETVRVAACGSRPIHWHGDWRLEGCAAGSGGTIYRVGSRSRPLPGGILPSLRDLVASHGSDYVVIALGTNMAGISTTRADVFQQVTGLLAQLPPTVRCTWVGPPKENHRGLNAERLTANLRDAVSSRCRFIDSLPLTNLGSLSDGVHLVAGAAEDWANRVLEQLDGPRPEVT